MNTEKPTNPPDKLTFVLRAVIGTIAVALLLAGAWYGWAYVTSPAAIRQPLTDHKHIRLQVINNGQPVDFSKEPFQTPYQKDFCNAALTKEPFHFHDGKDQFIHLHWLRLTGGLLLKDYGWNFIGGTNDVLGYRFDKLPWTTPVAIHGRALPAPPAGTKYFIYTGNQSGYQERNWDEFLHQDLVTFLSGQPQQTSWLDWLAPAASAHGDEDHSGAATSEQQLIQLNDLIGNVVIFAQKDRPTDAAVKARFEHLEPLPQSSCAG